MSRALTAFFCLAFVTFAVALALLLGAPGTAHAPVACTAPAERSERAAAIERLAARSSAAVDRIVLGVLQDEQDAELRLSAVVGLGRRRRAADGTDDLLRHCAEHDASAELRALARSLLEDRAAGVTAASPRRRR
ncbi:MAG: hypothetical protein AAF957_16875 [Planctomycetota bacterium]